MKQEASNPHPLSSPSLSFAFTGWPPTDVPAEPMALQALLGAVLVNRGQLQVQPAPGLGL